MGRPRHRHRSACADRRRTAATPCSRRRSSPSGRPTTSTSRCSSTSRTTRSQTALEVARALGPKLWGVRLDTSEMLVDRSLWEEMGDFEPTRRQRAPRPQGARRARRATASSTCKIVVSGGFTVGKIEEFEEKGVPGRRLRRRLVADPRLERLHRRHRAHRRAPVREGRPAPSAEPAARARHVTRFSGTSTRRSISCCPHGKLYAQPARKRRFPR